MHRTPRYNLSSMPKQTSRSPSIEQTSWLRSNYRPNTFGFLRDKATTFVTVLLVLELESVDTTVKTDNVTRHHWSSIPYKGELSRSWHMADIQMPKPNPLTYKYPFLEQVKGSNFLYFTHFNLENFQSYILHYLTPNSSRNCIRLFEVSHFK